MILKNVKHRIKLALNNLQIVSRYDVLIEKSVTIKFPQSVSFGSKCTLQSGAYVYGSRSGHKVEFGNNVVVASCGMILGEGGITVGDNTHFGPHVIVTSQYGDSSSDMGSGDTILKYSKITVGHTCWVGSGSVVMPGVSLGDRCVVSPNSVVYGEWPADSRLMGNPARALGARSTRSNKAGDSTT